MESKILVKPTEKQYEALPGAFDYFNEKLFKDSLPQVMRGKGSKERKCYYVLR